MEEYNLHVLLKDNFKAQFLLPSCWSLIFEKEDHVDDHERWGAVRGWHSNSKKNCTKKYEMEKIIKNTIERVIAKEKVMEWEILWRDDREILSRSSGLRKSWWYGWRQLNVIKRERKILWSKKKLKPLSRMRGVKSMQGGDPCEILLLVSWRWVIVDCYCEHETRLGTDFIF